MNILATTSHAGSVHALKGPIEELQRRGHDVTIYATGNDNEVRAFGHLRYERIQPSLEDCIGLVRGYDVVLVGLPGSTMPDSNFIRAAHREQIPSVAVNDQNYNYSIRFGADCVPTIIAMMMPECITKAQQELPEDLGTEVARRSKIVGWTAYDYLGKMKEEFTSQQREEILRNINVDPDHEVYLHCTENIHPETRYWQAYSQFPLAQKQAFFNYNQKLTTKTFEAAHTMGLHLIVKPHPGEEPPYTWALCQHYGFTFIPAVACDSRSLILTATAVTAGKSSILNDSCLLDRTTAGLIPEATDEEVSRIQAVALGAIPYTRDWDTITAVLSMLTRPHPVLHSYLAQKRTHFSVDGNASARTADLVESLK